MLDLPDCLEGPRLTLNKPRLTDAEAVFARWTADPEVTRYLTWSPHRAVEDTRGWLRNIIEAFDGHGSHVAWLMHDATGPVGAIGVTRERHRLSLGYVVARAYWGRGYATEASQTLLQFARTLPGVGRIDSVCDVDNHASARVLEKVGMRFEGVLERWIHHPNLSAEPRDVRSYVLPCDPAPGD